jgi:sulfatase maturation enzyme AslB (radical SAM superfamily)
MSTVYYANINYVCNERCIFCAAGMANGPLTTKGRVPWVTLQEIVTWVNGTPPGPEDRVLIAGGEPTLHPELVLLLRYLGQNCRNVVIFTNGLRLAQRDYAWAVIEAGVTTFEIPFYGASAESHDSVTRRKGSFEGTITALTTLVGLRGDAQFRINIRLLIARQCFRSNPAIVQVLSERVPRVDGFSLNPLVLSADAEACGAAVDYEEARPFINEAARLARVLGYRLIVNSIPLCVFDGENASWLRHELCSSSAVPESGLCETRRQQRLYIDPFVAAGVDSGVSLVPRRTLPDICLECDYARFCQRVEPWYVRNFGPVGLRPVRFSEIKTTAGR